MFEDPKIIINFSYKNIIWREIRNDGVVAFHFYQANFNDNLTFLNHSRYKMNLLTYKEDYLNILRNFETSFRQLVFLSHVLPA